jgi:hypothetical protein
LTDLASLIVAVHHQLDDATLPHAFGGALALAYVAVPRGTVDIDVNVFVGTEELVRVDDALEQLGYRRSDPGTDTAGFGGIRLVHEVEPFPVDVFPSLDDRYSNVERRVAHHPFGPDGERLPFLSAEDLAVFKLSFGRPQDWVDLEAIATNRPELDLAYVEEQLVALRGPTMNPRFARFRLFWR